jgi:endo-1,4-beta-D-glucanase Y
MRSLVRVVFVTPLVVACLGQADDPQCACVVAGGAAGTLAGSAGTAGAGLANAGGAAGSAGVGGAAGASAGTASGSAGVAGTGGAAGSGGAGAGGAAGTAGVAGAAGTAGVAGAPTTLGPPYTFPQGYRSPHCTYPTGLDPLAAKAPYEQWKTELLTRDGAGEFLRVIRPDDENGSTNTTVSEGIGYGMILAVVMGDQDVFDDLWKYSQTKLNERGLMHWLIFPDGTVQGQGAATDADEDMAWALVMADRKWGGSGTLDAPYIDLAKAQIQKIWDHEVDHSRGDLLLAGDSWGPVTAFNPSYFAPNQYRLFGRVTANEAGWGRVIDKGYSVLAAGLKAELGNLDNGLLPAWSSEGGDPNQPFENAPTHYQYDSARIPFRIGQDFCDYGEPRAKTHLDKQSAFFSGIGAPNIVDGYNLDGTARAENTMPAGVQSALFVGAAGVGAMSASGNLAFVDATYQLLVTKEMLPRSRYFNLSWQVLSLLMMTGNLYDYTLVQ